MLKNFEKCTDALTLGDLRQLLNKLAQNNTYFSNLRRPSSLSELTPMVFNMGLTHLGSEASICTRHLRFIKLCTDPSFLRYIGAS